MSKEPRPLAEVLEIAATVAGDLSPFCERIALAGSARRRKPQVGDLELVAIPRWANTGGLFQTEPVNTLWEHLHRLGMFDWLKGDNPQGRYYQLQLPHELGGLQLDLFLADAHNWGWIFLMRTGSSAFSTQMLTRWKACQHIPSKLPGSIGGRLVTRMGVVVPTPEEEDVFRLCKMVFVPPEKRSM